MQKELKGLLLEKGGWGNDERSIPMEFVRALDTITSNNMVRDGVVPGVCDYVMRAGGKRR